MNREERGRDLSVAVGRKRFIQWLPNKNPGNSKTPKKTMTRTVRLGKNHKAKFTDKTSAYQLSVE
ncbi:hypothetical protein RUM43_004698 [Polyplax serrata]|uniref:Uncharacterized protein n=1 Tax=Polyplax serrata TaxID=468196 RepID=A0AAN8XMC0_POLSC